MARRHKLTPELQESICHKIKLGCTRKYAAIASGICESTFFSWMARGEKHHQGLFVEFLESIKKAEAEAIASYEVELRKLANKGNPTAIIFYLQNRASEVWKDRRLLEHSGPTGGPIELHTLDLSSLSIEELKKLADLDAGSKKRDSQTGKD
ncbi:MAG: hypothetical protein DDT29_00378 [Dehalococcoidia bacterium]|nr:hypothetical protein [Bacillota bacterium]